MALNSLVISALIVEAQALRFTPAGVPALNLVLDHASETTEAGTKRQVSASLKAMAFGSVAERLARQPIGSNWKFEGFLANAVRSKSLVLHIQDFSPD
ncbi:MAG: primosomal replication protein N [Rhodoferax sp.]